MPVITNDNAYELHKSGKFKINYTVAPLIRFWACVNKRGPIHSIHGQCWQWEGCNIGRYGQIYVNSVPFRSHRYSWIIHNGGITNDLCVLHKCDNTLCVNPNHLFLGTQQDNNKDKFNKGRQSRIIGADNVNTKLSDEQVRIIRASYKVRCKYNGRKALAKKFKVSISLIDQIVSRACRKYVD